MAAAGTPYHQLLGELLALAGGPRSVLLVLAGALLLTVARTGRRRPP